MIQYKEKGAECPTCKPSGPTNQRNTAPYSKSGEEAMRRTRPVTLFFCDWGTEFISWLPIVSWMLCMIWLKICIFGNMCFLWQTLICVQILYNIQLVYMPVESSLLMREVMNVIPQCYVKIVRLTHHTQTPRFNSSHQCPPAWLGCNKCNGQYSCIGN